MLIAQGAYPNYAEVACKLYSVQPTTCVLEFCVQI